MENESDLYENDPKSETEAFIEDLDNFFLSKKIRCEICHNENTWYTLRGPDDQHAISYKVNPTLLDDGGYNINMYAYICLDCGNIKFLHKFIVKSEIKKMKNKQRTIKAGHE